jgi:hypothetical protein
VILLNQRATHSSNRSRCFGDEPPSAAVGSRRWSTPAASGTIGGAHRRRAEEGTEGPTSSKLGPMGVVRRGELT